MTLKKTRLRKAEEKYCEELHEWLTNPKNEDLPSEIVEPQIEAAFNDFFQALIQDEEECADFVSKGNILDEIEFLPLIFEHFKSKKIYDAIQTNCEIAFSHKYSVESEESEKRRKELLYHMQDVLHIG